jgi:hypothetical protein
LDRDYPVWNLKNNSQVLLQQPHTQYLKQHGSQHARSSALLKPDDPGVGSSTDGNYFSSLTWQEPRQTFEHDERKDINPYEILNAWFNEHKESLYPSQIEKTLLSTQTGLDMIQIINWFAEARARKQSSILSNYELTSDHSIAQIPATSGSKDTETSERSVSESGFSIWTDCLESDIEPCYEGYEALDPLRHTLACRLLEAYQARSSEPRSYGTGDSGQPYTSQSSSGFATGKGLVLPSSEQCSGQKRARGQRSPDDGSGSPDDGEGPSKIPRNGKTNKDLRLLACPFYKKDPRKYRCCNQHVLREINRVK